MPRSSEWRLAGMPGLEPFVPEHPQALHTLDEVAIMNNRQSYGMAYLANHVRPIAESAVASMERTLRDYLISRTGPGDYKATRE